MNPRRKHVLVLDRNWPNLLTDDGAPLLPSDIFRVSVLAGAAAAGSASLGIEPDLVHSVDVFDETALTALVDKIHADHPIDRIAALPERLLLSAARLRNRLNLPGDDESYVLNFRDKARMKNLALTAGIQCARGGVVFNDAEVLELLASIDPLVLKPRDGAGSRGVQILSAADDLDRLDIEWTPSGLLWEEYLPSSVCHIDAVVTDSRTIWEVSMYGRPPMSFIERLPTTSSTVESAGLRRAAAQLLRDVVKAWDVKQAAIHLEAFWNGSSLIFGEVACRPGGAGIGEVFGITRGLDLDHAKLLIDAGGDPLELLRAPNATHAGWIVHYSLPGVLREIADEAFQKHSYSSHKQAINTPALGTSFAGTGVAQYVFADDSWAEVQRLLDLAERHIRISVDTVPALRN